MTTSPDVPGHRRIIITPKRPTRSKTGRLRYWVTCTCGWQHPSLTTDPTALFMRQLSAVNDDRSATARRSDRPDPVP